MASAALLALIPLLYIVFKLSSWGRREAHLPPGPPTTPIIGNILNLPENFLQLQYVFPHLLGHPALTERIDSANGLINTETFSRYELHYFPLRANVLLMLSVAQSLQQQHDRLVKRSVNPCRYG